MDTHIPAEYHLPNISEVLLRSLLRQLDAALPAAASSEIAADSQEAAHEMFFAHQPRDPVEAAAAVRAVIAHFAAMDLHARASRPGLSDDVARRLRTSAKASARAADVLRRAKPRQPAAAAPPPREPAPDPKPLPPIYQFQPRDRFGQPIPRGYAEQMTMAQRRATYAPKYDPEIEAAALADEAAMIAEQQALEAREREAAAVG